MNIVWKLGTINALYKFNNTSDSSGLQAFMMIQIPLPI